MPVRNRVIISLYRERAKRFALAKRAYYAAMTRDAPWSELQHWTNECARYARRADLYYSEALQPAAVTDETHSVSIRHPTFLVTGKTSTHP